MTTRTGAASNVKGLMGNQMAVFGGVSLPNIGLGAASIAGGPSAALASLIGGSPDRKSGLSTLNPSFRKMKNRGTGSIMGGARSQTSRFSRSRSQGTRRTGRTGTMSRKSRASQIDWDAMEIEEIDVMIEGAEAEMEQLVAERRQI